MEKEISKSGEIREVQYTSKLDESWTRRASIFREDASFRGVWCYINESSNSKG